MTNEQRKELNEIFENIEKEMKDYEQKMIIQQAEIYKNPSSYIPLR